MRGRFDIHLDETVKSEMCSLNNVQPVTETWDVENANENQSSDGNMACIHVFWTAKLAGFAQPHSVYQIYEYS